MSTICRTYVSSCERCLQFRNAPSPPACLQVGMSGLFQRFSIDFVGPMKAPRIGNRYLILAVEHVASWPIAKAVPVINKEILTNFLLSDIISKFGCPYHLLSDGGGQFISALYSDVLRLLGIERQITSPDHPQTNGKVERLSGTLIREMSKMCASKGRWNEVLDLALFSYRVRPQRNGLSPFRILYGADPRPLIDVLEKHAMTPLYQSDFLRRLELDSTILSRMMMPDISFDSQKPRLETGERAYCLRTKALQLRSTGKDVPKFEPIFSGP